MYSSRMGLSEHEVHKAIQQAIMSHHHPVPVCYRSPMLDEVKAILNGLDMDQEALEKALLRKDDGAAWGAIVETVEENLDRM